ncbi:replication protein C, IncQ-type [Elstera cyanobacteriorum]|uniref:replication protein C, IncQ-type n=1 Tax=Elstera cyanobacteriorum TaxID=2022747 RepID=UPI00235456C4|nr:replication protein C, IncQ-type [Elstera cyanobacteriorum]MCK6443327.1 replication initiator protein A [Elstera cyanobacteriorum]
MTMNPTRRRHDEQQIARLDRPVALSPLFRMGEGKEVKYRTQFTYDGDPVEIEITSRTTLGATEQDVLLAIEQIASTKGFRLETGGKIAIETTAAAILRALNDKHEGGREFGRVKEAVEKLASVTVKVEKKQSSGRYKPVCIDNLISLIGDQDGKLVIRIHPVFGHIIRGGSGYIQIDLKERMRLDSTGRILHAVVCSTVNRGSTGRMLIGSLCQRTWGDPRPLARRKEALNHFFDEIEKMGWTATVERPEGRKASSGDPVVFVRPAAKPVKSPSGLPARRLRPTTQPINNAVPDEIDIENEPCPF